MNDRKGGMMPSVLTCSYCDEPATHRLKFARDKPLCQTHLDKIRKAAVDDAMREFDKVFEKGE